MHWMRAHRDVATAVDEDDARRIRGNEVADSYAARGRALEEHPAESVSAVRLSAAWAKAWARHLGEVVALWLADDTLDAKKHRVAQGGAVVRGRKRAREPPPPRAPPTPDEVDAAGHE